MSDELKTAKEEILVTTMYCHECPCCGDYKDESYRSQIGEILECGCGEKYRVVK